MYAGAGSFFIQGDRAAADQKCNDYAKKGLQDNHSGPEPCSEGWRQGPAGKNLNFLLTNRSKSDTLKIDLSV